MSYLFNLDLRPGNCYGGVTQGPRKTCECYPYYPSNPPNLNPTPLSLTLFKFSYFQSFYKNIVGRKRGWGAWSIYEILE